MVMFPIIMEKTYNYKLGAALHPCKTIDNKKTQLRDQNHKPYMQMHFLHSAFQNDFLSHTVHTELR